MIQLLIADDEKWICTLIESMIDFQGLGLQLAGMAYDGEEAIQMILNKQPDIVITDIKMPCADGLQVIKTARDAGLDTKFIILSGYSTFEYAKTAVRYHVEDYLLKPINTGQLNEALEKICISIRNKQDQQKAFHRLLGNLESATEKVRTHLVTSVVYSPSLLQGKTMDELNAAYHYHFVSGAFQIMLLHALPLETDLPISQVLRKLDQLLRSRLSLKCCEYESLVDQHRIVILINYNETLHSLMPEIIEYSFRSTLVSDEISSLLQCALYIGKPVTDPHMLPASYTSAEHITNLGILLGMGNCYSAAALPPLSEGTTTARVNTQQADKLLQLLTNGLPEDIHSFCDSLLTSWNNRLLAAPEELDGLLSSLFEAIEGGCRERGISLGGLEVFREEFFFSFRLCSSRADLLQHLEQALKQFQTHIQNIISSNKSLPIAQAREYIHSHYAEKLSIEAMSDQVFLSPNYFSALFKKETGLNFSDYVAQVRIKRAKQLLQDPQYTIAQVGEKVGYPDPRYFSKLFKKVVGIKPHEYRKICALSHGIEEGNHSDWGDTPL